MRGGGNTSWRGVARPRRLRGGGQSAGHARGKCVRRAAYVKVACVECPPWPANPALRIPSLHPGSSSPARSSPVEKQQCVFQRTMVSRSTDEDDAGETPGSCQWREAKGCPGALRDGCRSQIRSCARLYLLQRGSRSEAVRQARPFRTSISLWIVDVIRCRATERLLRCRTAGISLERPCSRRRGCPHRLQG